MWSADVDYVRLTMKHGADEEYYASLYKSGACEVMAAADGEVVEPRRWAAMGYTGLNYGLVQVGSGREGYIYQASGWAAAHTRALGLPWDNCSRVDVQVTLWYASDCSAQIRVQADRCAITEGRKGGSGRNVRFIEGYGRGDTAYIGSRTSDRFIRIYDKDRESKGDFQYENALRYEVEFKGDLAGQVWEAYGGSRVAPEAYAGLVADELRRASVYVKGLYTLRGARSPQSSKGAPSIDSRLAWLDRSVAPAVEGLLASGYRRDYLIELLGLGPDGGRNRAIRRSADKKDRYRD